MSNKKHFPRDLNIGDKQIRQLLANPAEGKVKDIKINGVSILDTTTKEASFDITASVVENDTSGTPTATATMQDGNINIEFEHVKGDKGDPLTWNDLTEAQKAELKGDQGDSVIVGEGDLPLANTLGNSSIKAITQKIVTENFDALNNEIYERTPDGYSETRISLDGKIVANGKTINCTNGKEYSSGSYIHTDYIDISEYSKIKYGKVTRITNTNPKAGIAFYSSQNEDGFISGVASELVETLFTEYIEDIADVPPGARYVRIPVFNSQDAESQYLYGLNPSYQKRSKIASLIESNEAIRGEINDGLYVDVPEGETQTDLEPMSSNITYGYAVVYGTGALYESNGYDVSGMIDVSEYNYIVYSRPKSNKMNTNLGMAFYDSNETCIIGSGQQALYNADGMDAYVMTRLPVPSGAKYVRISINKDTQSFGEPMLLGIKSSLIEKKLLSEVLGESSKVTLTQSDVCYGNQIASDGSVITTYGEIGLGCTSFVCCMGAATISITKAVIEDSSIAEAVGIAFYDITKSLVGFDSLLSGEGKGSEESTIDVPKGACYLRATYWDGEHTDEYGEFHAAFTSKAAASNGKRESVGDYIYFTVPVNQAVDKFWVAAVDEPQLDEEVIKDTTGVLLLPSTYKANGEKTRLIINFHGWSHYVKYEEWGNGSAGFLKQKLRWSAAGFAVMDCNNWRYDLEGGQSGLGSRQSMEAYRKCFEWVKANFNIDERPYIVCGSAGGPTGINCCYAWNDVRAAVWLDCWVDLEENQNSYISCKKYFPELFGFADKDTWEADKVVGYDPYGRVRQINDEYYMQAPLCPVKVLWRSESFAEHFYEALRNGGAFASIRQVDANSISHANLVSGGDDTNPNSANIDTEIIAYLKSF